MKKSRQTALLITTTQKNEQKKPRKRWVLYVLVFLMSKSELNIDLKKYYFKQKVINFAGVYFVCQILLNKTNFLKID